MPATVDPTHATPDGATSPGTRAVLDRFLASLRANLEEILRKPATLEVRSLASEEAATARLALPPDGVAFAARIAATHVPALLCIADLPCAKAFLEGLTNAEGPAEPAPASGTPFDETARLALLQVAGLVADAATATISGPAATPLEPKLHLLADSTWDGGEDPLASGAWNSAEIALGLAGSPVGCIRVLLPPGTAETAASGEVPAGAVGSPAEAREDGAKAGVPGPIVYCIGTPDVARRLATTLGLAEIQTVAGTGEVISRLEAGLRPVLVLAQVQDQGEEFLQHLADLARHKDLTGKRLVLLLENPVKSLVLLCGKLGLVNVLPLDVEDEVLRRRLLPSLVA